jgi:hypothetical protein
LRSLDKPLLADTSLTSLDRVSHHRNRCEVELQTPKASAGRFNAAGFVIWLVGYLSAGHASIFHWDVATPWWISSFVPNLEAELGLALMFASVIPIYGRAVQGNLARLFAYVALLVFAAVILAWWGFLAWLIWHVI